MTTFSFGFVKTTSRGPAERKALQQALDGLTPWQAARTQPERVAAWLQREYPPSVVPRVSRILREDNAPGRLTVAYSYPDTGGRTLREVIIAERERIAHNKLASCGRL